MKVLATSLLVLGGALVLGCHPHDHAEDVAHDHAPAADAGHGHAHAESTLVFTRWTDRTELFVEFPALVVGQESPFATHLTRLDDFAPVEAGRLVVTLAGGGAPEEVFEVRGPSVPGIFRPVARPQRAGSRILSLRLESADLTDEHVLGMVTVHGDADAAAHAASPDDGGDAIAFLKEQQWPIDFATAEARREELRPSLAVSGTVRARADGEVHVTAPVSGRLLTAGSAFPRIGAEVESDQVLVDIAPRLGAEVDIASLELAVARAELEVDHASQELRRLTGLLEHGAVSERRVVAARKEEQQARADLDAAQRRVRQYGRVQQAAGAAGGDVVAVRAPLGGTLVGVVVAPGMFLDEGSEMFHIVDLGRLWLELRVPEANIDACESPTGAWFELQGSEDVFQVPGDAVVASGGVVDAATRTIPLIFAIDNPDRRLRVGMFARAYVVTGEPVRAVAVPAAAVLDDGGQSVVFVQSEGETFERRVVRLGIRDADKVEVVSGVRAGERVVTRGAYMVKLAASATEAPAHGHAH